MTKLWPPRTPYFSRKKALYLGNSEICNSHLIYLYKRKTEIIYGIIIRMKILWSHSRKLTFFLHHEWSV